MRCKFCKKNPQTLVKSTHSPYTTLLQKSPQTCECQFYKRPLNFYEIDTHSVDGNFMKTSLDFGKTHLHSTKIILIENPPDFCEINPLMCIVDILNRLAHLHTAYIYHNIDTYDDCHIQVLSLRTIHRYCWYPVAGIPTLTAARQDPCSYP